jgi:hypothetical protein
MPTSKKHTSQVKPYEHNVYHKRARQLSKDIYNLPLDVKLIIYQMAIDTHMERWKQSHKDKMKSWSGLKSRHKPFSCLDLIKGWGIQAPIHKYFPYVSLDTEGFRGSIPDDYKVKLCKLERVCTDGILNKHGEIFEIRDTPPYLSRDYYLNDGRAVRDRPHSWWVGKTCRCLTCDLIRLANNQEGGSGKIYKHTYRGLIYMGGELLYMDGLWRRLCGQWKPQVVDWTTKELKELRHIRKT